MKLNDIFTRTVVTASPTDTLASVARAMLEHNVGTVIVTTDGRPAGIVTDRDLALALGARGANAQAAVQEVMTRHVLAIPDDMGVYTATRFMRERGVRRLPIVDREDRLVGIVTLDDLLRFLGRELYNLSEGIKNEVQAR